MKVVAINGSPRLIGNTSNALNEVLDELNKEGIETEYIQIYEDHMNPCNACSSCEMRGDGRCINEDDRMNEYLEKLIEADGIILASPTYYGSCTAQMKMFLERAGLVLQYSNLALSRKVGGVVVIQERDGGNAVYSELVNFMLRNRMVVCGSSPATVLTGKNPGDYLKDQAGVKALRSLGQEMAWAIQALRI